MRDGDYTPAAESSSALGASNDSRIAHPATSRQAATARTACGGIHMPIGPHEVRVELD